MKCGDKGGAGNDQQSFKSNLWDDFRVKATFNRALQLFLFGTIAKILKLFIIQLLTTDKVNCIEIKKALGKVNIQQKQNNQLTAGGKSQTTRIPRTSTGRKTPN